MARVLRLSLALLALLAIVGAANASGVSYSQMRGECQTGEKQSPINIVMGEAKEESVPEKFMLAYDSAPTTATVINKGYTPHHSLPRSLSTEVAPNPEKSYKLHIGSDTYNLLQPHHSLPRSLSTEVAPNPETSYKLHIGSGTYNLLQMHVHSFFEHAVNGLFSPIEAHFVHVHESDPNVLAVVSVMIRLQRHDEAFAWVDT
ncbi:unnamed protein product [Closterium sp. Naga37s-1]|nr:unnamed protein product [Closterium sp. Naga37s-1]